MLKWLYTKVDVITAKMAHNLMFYPYLRNRKKLYYKAFHVLSDIEFAMRKYV